MSSKRELGQYYTQNNPFTHPLFKKWMDLIYKDDLTILEPFAGANNIVKLIIESGYKSSWKCYDINPSLDNVVPEFNVEYRDTISYFPQNFDVCITNPPYLGKSSARRRHIDFPWEEDDLYKTCVKLMLQNCKYVAAIIPESFITSSIHHNDKLTKESFKRLWGVISLTCKMFDDTDCPVCLALFTPDGRPDVEVYSGESYLGRLSDLASIELTGCTNYHVWKFNDKNGSIGVKTVDSQSGEDCKFFKGENITPEDIKITSRSFTRISGLPDNIDRETFFDLCNEILSDYRKNTKDVLMTSFKGLRKDGKYRRRLDFKTVKCIMNMALARIENKKWIQKSLF